jgi:hypothetical protein
MVVGMKKLVCRGVGRPLCMLAPKAGDRCEQRSNEGKLLVTSKPGISVDITVLESQWSSRDECEYGALKREAAFRKKKGPMPVASDSNLVDQMQRSSDLLAAFYQADQGRLPARVCDGRWSTPVRSPKRSVAVVH